jgi:hypothetical protein
MYKEYIELFMDLRKLSMICYIKKYGYDRIIESVHSLKYVYSMDASAIDTS